MKLIDEDPDKETWEDAIMRQIERLWAAIYHLECDTERLDKLEAASAEYDANTRRVRGTPAPSEGEEGEVEPVAQQKAKVRPVAVAWRRRNRNGEWSYYNHKFFQNCENLFSHETVKQLEQERDEALKMKIHYECAERVVERQLKNAKAEIANLRNLGNWRVRYYGGYLKGSILDHQIYRPEYIGPVLSDSTEADEGVVDKLREDGPEVAFSFGQDSEDDEELPNGVKCAICDLYYYNIVDCFQEAVQRLQREGNEARERAKMYNLDMMRVREERDGLVEEIRKLRAKIANLSDPENWEVGVTDSAVSKAAHFYCGHTGYSEKDRRRMRDILLASRSELTVRPSDSTEAESVESYILEKISVGRTLRPSELFTIAREERAPFTEQELRRKVWTLVHSGRLELTDETKLHHPPSPENEPAPSDSTEADDGESVEGVFMSDDFGWWVSGSGECRWATGTPVRITLIGPPESEGETDD